MTVIQDEIRETVLGFKHQGLVNRLCKKESMSVREAEELFKDLLRFMYLCMIPHAGRLAPPEKIDVVWHHFILFTRDYADFCERSLGRFVHHSPLVEKPKRGTDGLMPLERTLRLAKAEFGDLSSNWDAKAEDCIDIPSGECSPSTNCQE